MTISRALFSALLLTLVIAPAPLFAQRATIRHISGGRAEERSEAEMIITAETWKEGLTARKAGRAGSRMNLKASEVVRVDWDQAPKAYQKAMNTFDDGDYAKAAGLFEEAAAAGGSYDWLKIYCAYYRGASLARIGAAAEAIEAFKKVIDIDRNHRFVPDCYDKIADLAMRPGGPGASVARDALTKLQGLGIGGDYDLRVTLGLARIELREGDPRKAQDQLRGLLTQASSAPAVQQLVRLELGNVEVRLGNHAAAASAFKDILDAKAGISDLVRAGATNGLGDALFAQQKWQEAFDAYSKTFVWFISQDALRAQVGHALYQGGVALQNLSGTQQGEEKAATGKNAGRLLNRAAKDFGDTRGGQAARKALGR